MLTSTSFSGSFLFPARSRLMRCWRRKRCQTKIGQPNVRKSGPSTCWSELQRISEYNGKPELQGTGLRRMALLPLRWSQQLESPRWTANELVLMRASTRAHRGVPFRSFGELIKATTESRQMDKSHHIKACFAYIRRIWETKCIICQRICRIWKKI